jgi:hypothetical protein
LKAVVSESSSRLVPDGSSILSNSRAAVIVVISPDTRLIGSLTSRASQKLPSAASRTPPNAIVARANSASCVAARAAASTDVSMKIRAGPENSIGRIAYSSLLSLAVPALARDRTRSRATSSGTVRATTESLTVITTPAVERFESSCA